MISIDIHEYGFITFLKKSFINKIITLIAKEVTFPANIDVFEVKMGLTFELVGKGKNAQGINKQQTGIVLF